MTTPLIGRLLRPLRAGVGKTAWFHPATTVAPQTITVTSPAFADGAAIPKQHAGPGIGDNISPPLHWCGVPENAVELVLVIEDPDVPLPRPYVHGVTSGIAPWPNEIGQGALQRYAGHCPIRGHGPHRYVFQLFALDTQSGLDKTANLGATLAAIKGCVIARGRLTGTYQRD
jgi:phosphatidylethanolamine-binding protein (PEBP) family uncharacterized protein